MLVRCVSALSVLALSSLHTFARPWGARQWGGAPLGPDGSFSHCVLGAALLDLEQTTLPGIAHLVVETMIVSDQIRPEDRASVLRTLLLKHRCEGLGKSALSASAVLGPLSVSSEGSQPDLALRNGTGAYPPSIFAQP